MFAQKQAPALSPRLRLEQQYKISRNNLLLVIICTLVSLAMIAFADRYFLFSAYLPISYFSSGFYCWQIGNGTYAYMNDVPVEDIPYYQQYGELELIIGIVIAAVILLAYFICWLCSKKHTAAMVVATVLFGIDCGMLLYDCVVLQSFEILDILFHALVMYYLIVALVAKAKLKKLPPEEEAPVEAAYTVINGENVPSASATPSEFGESGETRSNEDNTPAE